MLSLGMEIQDSAQTGIILLPQTVLRFWGIPNVESFKFFQTQLPLRYDNDHLFVDEYYKLNKMMLDVIGVKNISSIKLENTADFNKSNALIDSHILNLSFHFIGEDKISDVSVVSYASDGYSSLLLSDVRYIEPFLRGVIRSFRLKRKFNPKVIWHWDDYAKLKKNRLLNFGWDHNFINSDVVSFYAKKFLIKNIHNFQEIADFNTDKSTILIYPPVNLNIEQLFDLLNKQIAANHAFKRTYTECDQILIKQHKFCTSDYPATFNFHSKEIRVAKSINLRVLPIEILLFGFRKVTYVSPPTTSIFSSSLNFTKIIWGEKIANPPSGYAGAAGYELMLKRHKIRFT
jgi:hypothetical protein